MADGLNKSLDDLIKETRHDRKAKGNKGDRRGGNKGKSGAVKANRDNIVKPSPNNIVRGNRDNRIQQQTINIKKPFDARNDNNSILSRLGDNKGIEVCFSNLNPDIPVSDIQELW